MKPFPLTRYFIATSFVTAVVVGVVTAVISARAVREELIQNAKDEAVDVIWHLCDELTEVGGVEGLRAGEKMDAGSEPFETIDRTVNRIGHRFNLAKIHVFDLDGLILYSTDHERVGQRQPEGSARFLRAINGESNSVIKDIGAQLHLQDGVAPHSLLETYVPVRWYADRGDTRVTHVVETYQIIDDLREEMWRAQLEIAAYSFGSSMVLFLVLIGIVVRAQKLIHSQTRQLIDSNRQLTDLSHGLEDEVERRTEELLDKEKLASLGVLAAGLAHEVNNPLATISSCSQGLKARLDESKDSGDLNRSDFETYLELIESEAFRVKRITQNLLDFARTDRGEERRPVDPEQLLEETIELVQVGEEAAGIAIELECDASREFTANETELRRILFNLTQNAIHAVRERFEDNGIGDGWIRWSVREGGEGLELVCRDNGIGFDPERARDLLQPFYTTKAPGRGTGLGLALCHSSVRGQGGKMTVSSDGVGKGAEVHIVLPRHGEERRG